MDGCQLLEQVAPPKTQNWAQNGWFRAILWLDLTKLVPSSNRGSSGMRVHATTVGATAPFLFMTILECEHIIFLGSTFNLPQHLSVISGTRSKEFISGKERVVLGRVHQFEYGDS